MNAGRHSGWRTILWGAGTMLLWLCLTAAPKTASGQGAGSLYQFIGDLPPGETVHVVWDVVVTNPLPAGVSNVCNQGTVYSGGERLDVDVEPANHIGIEQPTDDPDTPVRDDPTCTDIEAAPDLAITKDDGDRSALPGEVVVYTLMAANLGNQDASGVVVTDTVPANTTFNLANSTPGWSCGDGAPAGATCSFAVGDLAGAGGSTTVLYAVTVTNPLPTGVREIVNSVVIVDDGRNGFDPAPPNNSDGDNTPLKAFTNVIASGAALGTFATWDLRPQSGTYFGTIELCNIGPYSLTGPFWYLLEHTADFRLMHPDGVEPSTGWEYIDVTPMIEAALANVGNGDEALDPEECVTFGEIEVYSRDRTPPPVTILAFFADPPGVSSSVDSDSDGMPNAWENGYAPLNAYNRYDAEADSDDDGVINLYEWYADTDPTDPGSVLRILSVDPEQGGVVLRWTGGKKVTQYLELSTNLVDWWKAYTNAPPTSVTGTLEHISDQPVWFYRIKVNER